MKDKLDAEIIKFLICWFSLTTTVLVPLIVVAGLGIYHLGRLL